MDATLQDIIDLVAQWKIRALQAENMLRSPEVQAAMNKPKERNEKLLEGNDNKERPVQQDGSDAVASADKRPNSDKSVRRRKNR